MTVRGDSALSARYRFREFEADLRTGELFKRGVPVKLAEQPLQILSLLLERPGELVTREELCARLWPGDTFVDFERGLNTAVRTLRRALGDSPRKPRFIETLPKRGYRFIAPVEPLEPGPADPDKSSSTNTDSTTGEPRRQPLLWSVAAVLGLASLGVFAVQSPSGLPPPQRADELVGALPPGLFHVWGAVSPDGRRLARRDGASEWLNVVDLATGEERLLVEEPIARQMAWSPDGAEIAYVVERAGEHRLEMVNVRSGERRDSGLEPQPPADIRVPVVWDSKRDRLLLSTWGGDWVGFLHLDSGRVVEVGAARELISRDMGLSPDGRLIAAVSQAGDIVVHQTDGSAEPAPLVVSPDTEAAPVWSRDGGTLLFLRQRGTDAGKTELWAIPVDRRTGAAAGEPTMLAEAPDPRLGVPPMIDQAGDFVWAKEKPPNRLVVHEVDPATGQPVGAPVDELPRGYWGGTWSAEGAVLRVDTNLDWPIPGMTAFRELDVTTKVERFTEARDPDLDFSRTFYSADLTKAAVRVNPPDGGSALFLYDAVEDELTEVISSGPRIWSAWLSHSTHRIAFLETEIKLGEAGAIAVADIASKQVRRFYQGEHVEKPVWSPDDSEIAFVDKPCIKIINVETAELKDLACYEPPPEEDVRVRTASPQWSPDGSMLIWGAINRIEKRHEVWIVDRGSGGHSVIWAGESDYRKQGWNPHWSADGRYVSFLLMDPLPVEIWKVRHPLMNGRRSGISD